MFHSLQTRTRYFIHVYRYEVVWYIDKTDPIQCKQPTPIDDYNLYYPVVRRVSSLDTGANDKYDIDMTDPTRSKRGAYAASYIRRSKTM